MNLAVVSPFSQIRAYLARVTFVVKNHRHDYPKVKPSPLPNGIPIAGIWHNTGKWPFLTAASNNVISMPLNEFLFIFEQPFPTLLDFVNSQSFGLILFKGNKIHKWVLPLVCLCQFGLNKYEIPIAIDAPQVAGKLPFSDNR